MNFYVYINGRTHRLVQGFTINEEYNETLDSATIIVSDSPQLDINPYDDVFIFSEYCGTYDSNLGKIVPNYNKKFKFKGYPINSILYNQYEKPCFYRHFLVYKFVEKIIVLGDIESNTRYEYTIDLFSETKGLETVQAPNISITQPLNFNQKISTYNYINMFLDMYNKKIKYGDSSSWNYNKKYTLGVINENDNNPFLPSLLSDVKTIFEKSYAPDFTLNNPTLRQILEKLFITKDCIPVVFDDKIYALDITKRRGKFNLKKGDINYITGSKSSENYCTDLKRTYSDALTQENSTRYVEYLGFRNNNSSLMTFENLRIETRFPIYKINKLYMCYYKKITFFDNVNHTSQDKVFLCKQDITPLVKLNSERNVLSEDIDDFSTLTYYSPIEKMAKYKLATVGYDIGSNYIEGWGTKYSYPTHNFFWQTEVKSYLENMFVYINRMYPCGIYNMDYIIKKISETETIPENYSIYFPSTHIVDTIVIPNYTLAGDYGDDTNIALHLKHLFFEIDYQGFYNGTVIHSKNIGKDNLTINDNQSSSLTLLELDGLAQKEKLNRYGNKGLQINARYTDLNDVQSLGSVYEHNNDKDVVIYHKEYSINDNVIDCSYSGTKDYVLKDYFTSVYARHRTYNLMSYGESVLRSENESVYLLISKDRKVNDYINISFSNFDENFIKSFFSFFNYIKSIEAYNRINDNQKINYGYFYKDGKYYSTDINVFVSGTSLCLNISMYDNVSSGVYISQMKSDYVYNLVGDNNTVIGSTQKWIMLVDSTETGKIDSLRFGFGHIQSGANTGYIDEDKVYNYSDFKSSTTHDKKVDELYNKLLNLPQIVGSPVVNNNIYFTKNIHKDNKEKIDMTMQIQPLLDNDVYLSPWVSKLSDLFSVYEKYYKNLYYSFNVDNNISVYSYTTFQLFNEMVASIPHPVNISILGFKGGDFSLIKEKFNNGETVFISGSITFEEFYDYHGGFDKITMNFQKITNINDDGFEVLCQCQGDIDNGQGGYNPSVFNYTLQYRKECITSPRIPIPHNIYETVKTNFLSKIDSTEDIDVYTAIVGDLVFASSSPYIYDNPTRGSKIGNTQINCYAFRQPAGTTVVGYTDLLSYTDMSDASFYDSTTVSELKTQNLFWVYTPSDYEFREYMVYDELDSLSEFTRLKYDYENWNAANISSSISGFQGKYVWNDGNSTYYSNGSLSQWYLYENRLWASKYWDGFSNLYGDKIWEVNGNIYYSDSANNNQYKLVDNSVWNNKTWSGSFNSFYGRYIWSDGTNTYYSQDSDQYILNSSTWEEESWQGYFTEIDSIHIWEKGNDIYYSHTYRDNDDELVSDQYKLDKETRMWDAVSWNILENVEGGGEYIWTDGETYYYSDNYNQYYLDEDTWRVKTWSGLNTNSDGRYVWYDGDNVYYSNGSTQYYFDDGEWKIKTWSGLTNFNAQDVWSDGFETYCSKSGITYLLRKLDSTWIQKTEWDSLNLKGEDVWLSGNKVYYSTIDNQFNGINYEFERNYKKFEPMVWTTIQNPDADYIWVKDGVAYYSNGSNQFYLDGTRWLSKTWNGYTQLNGSYIWNDGETYYASYGGIQLYLDGNEWKWKEWNGITGPDASGIWKDGDDVYYSSNGTHYHLNKETSTWVEITFTGFNNFSADNIWEHNDTIYVTNTDTYEFTKYTHTWSDDTTDNNGCLTFTHPKLEEGSHILCYYKVNNKYNFVFGFKPDANTNSTKIYLSLLRSKDLTIYDPISHLPVSEVENEAE